MGNAPSKSEPTSGRASGTEDGDSQHSKQSTFRSTPHEAPKAPVREETGPTQLPSIPTEVHERCSDGKHPRPEPSVEEMPVTSEHQVSPLKAGKKTPNGNIQGQDCSQDGLFLEASLQADTTIKLRPQNSMLTGEAIEGRDIALAYSDATAERTEDSKHSSNVDNTIAEEKPEGGCGDGLRDLEDPYTGPSEPTALCTEARHSGPRHSTEATSEVHSQSCRKSVRTLNLTSSQNVSISSASSKPSSSKIPSENSNFPSSTSIPTRQGAEKPWKTVVGASLLRVLPSYSMDMTMTNTFTWSSLDDPVLLRNILQFIRLIVASRRPMLSFALADQHGIELQLHSLVQGCPNEYNGNQQVLSSLDGLPCGTQRSERFGPQTLSPPQQPSSLRSAPLSHSKVDSLIREVRSFLKQVQQFSLLVENFPQQVQTVLEEVKTFYQQAEHFQHTMDSSAQEVPNSQTPSSWTALQVRSVDELRHSFASIVEFFARLIQTFSQQLNYSLQMAKEVNAASEQTQGHSQDAHGRSEEAQAVQGKVQSSPQRDGNSGQNKHVFAQHGHTFAQQAHFNRSLKSRMIQSPINTPTSRYSARSQRRNSPQDVVIVAAKQSRGGFPRGFGSAHREPLDLSQVEPQAAAANGDIVPYVEKSPSQTSQTEPSRNPPTTPGFVTTGGMPSSSRKDCSRADRSSSSTPPPLADAVVSEEGSGLGKPSENQCSSQSRRVGPHPESPAKDTLPKDLLGRPSESGELCIPSEASGVTAQPSPSRHPEVSAEGVQSSKDGSHTSPTALVQLWRSFSFIRKRARKDRKTE